MTKSAALDKSEQKTLMVCRGPACTRRGSDDLAAALEEHLPAGIRLARGGCFGRCPVGINALLRDGEVPECELDRRKVRDDDVLLSALKGSSDTLSLLDQTKLKGVRVLIGDDVRIIRR